MTKDPGVTGREVATPPMIRSGRRTRLRVAAGPRLPARRHRAPLAPRPRGRWQRLVHWRGWRTTGGIAAVAATVVTAVAAVTGGIAAVNALTYTAQTVRITEQGQYTDRFTKAVEQLGSDKLDVRLGGIYALERLAADSPRDRPTITEVLSAFVRQRLPEVTSTQCLAADNEVRVPLQVDQRAVLTVLGRRSDADKRATRADLSRICFPELTDLSGLDLSYANLRNAKLDHQWLRGVRLAHADLQGATLVGTQLPHANLDDANLALADLTDAVLGGTEIVTIDSVVPGKTTIRTRWEGATARRTVMYRATLTRADLRNVWLENAILNEADMRGAHLDGAHLDGALR